MRNTTLCYIEKDDKYLMLLRNKKKVDENKGKWVGVGGKFEEGESPEECLIREVKEETGLTLTSYKFRGIVTFVSSEWGCEYIFLYTADGFTGELSECSEGELVWIEKKDIFDLNMWEGDYVFLEPMMNTDDILSIKVVYDGDKMIDSIIY